jgi:hypothetical protein
MVLDLGSEESFRAIEWAFSQPRDFERYRDHRVLVDAVLARVPDLTCRDRKFLLGIKQRRWLTSQQGVRLNSLARGREMVWRR